MWIQFDCSVTGSVIIKVSNTCRFSWVQFNYLIIHRLSGYTSLYIYLRAFKIQVQQGKTNTYSKFLYSIKICNLAV